MEDFEYHSPKSLKEALPLLKGGGRKVKILAGGTDLVVQMKERLEPPSVLVDVKNIPELNHLDMSPDGTLHIGAAVPLSNIIGFLPVIHRFGILHQACSLIGSVQIRNRATMGGNICNAAPSADSAPPLLCLGARAIAANSSGTRAIPLENFFRGPGLTQLSDGELLLEIQIPTPPNPYSGCYLRHTTRQEMDIAVVGAGVLVMMPEQGDQCREVRISLGAVAPTPIRLPGVESFLAGKTLDDTLIAEASEMAAGTASPISDVRASAEYRYELIKVLVNRALITAREHFVNRYLKSGE
jgi:carbon-monoxide dehydrogenase medium subunit